MTFPDQSETSGGSSLFSDEALATLPETVIAGGLRVRFIQTIRDLWTYRELFAAFVARDVKVRYKQTALGVIWVVLQPLLASGLFAFVFARLGLLGQQDALGQVLFFMAGLVPWTAFALAVSGASASMEQNANLISKVYFPRLVVPAAYVCGAGVDFLIGFVVLLAIAIHAGAFTPWLLLLMPPLLLLQSLAACGIGFIFAALNAQYRDVKYVVPFVLQIGLFATVLMPLDRWPDSLQYVLACSPMTAVIETYRALLSGADLPASVLAQGSVTGLVMILAGIWFFRVREARMVDIL